jgi:Family of unknown function (DUF5906)
MTEPAAQLPMSEILARLNSPEEIAKRQADAEKKPRKPKKDVSAFAGDDKSNAWAKELYHVRFNNRIHRYGYATWSMESFNSEYAIKKPRHPDIDKAITPADYVKYRGFKMSVDNVAYAAGMPETFEFGGLKFVNLYHERHTPDTAEEYIDAGRKDVELIRAHILKMCSGNIVYAHVIESWIALNVREPGRLIGWAIMMKGIQGDGKSTIFDLLMTSLLGQANVGLVSSKEIKTDFNAWAYGKAYRHIAELKAAGSSRYEIEDTLKPHITDPSVRMIGKGANGEEVPNRTNYVGTTNHEDSIPLSDDDRRWFIIFTPWKSKEEMIEMLGCEDHDAYFGELRDAARRCGPYMRKYMLELELHPAVFHGSRAMDTEYKSRMVKAEYTNAGGDEFDAVLETGGYCISRDVVVPKILGARLIGAVGYNAAPRAKNLAALISSRGFFRIDDQIKWRGKVIRVYVGDKTLANRINGGDDLAKAELRRLLDATVPKEATVGQYQNENENIEAYEAAMMPVWTGKKPSVEGF